MKKEWKPRKCEKHGVHPCQDCAITALEEMPAVEDMTQQQSVEEKYRELIMAVESKYPTETRHETALRYIHEAENRLSEAQESYE